LSLPALSGEAATATSALQAAAAACAKGDVKTALGLFTDDATIRLSIEGMPDELFEGRSWVRVFWEIHSKGCKLDVGAAKDGAAGAPGASVPLKPAEFVIIHLANERFRALGAPQVTFQARVELRGEEISTLQLTLDPSEAPTVSRAILSNNRAVVLRFSDKVNRKEEMSAIDECVASEYTQHSIMPVGPGVPGLREFYARFRKAFPDLHYTVDDTRTDGDVVAQRITVRMTHRGEFMGVAPTGNPVTVTKMDFWRLMSGKVVEHWDAVDRLGLLQQIGVVPKLSEWQASPGFEGFR
ncbi:MAG TPA: ester cyclase, partial [Myxococcaceae bacterium]|nr:ester cyclase [Myxococcaceae bacterium]